MAQEIKVTPADRAPAPPAAPLNGPAGGPRPGVEPSLGELFKQLANESTTLIKQEMALAKLEMRQNMSTVAKDAALLAVGAGVLLVGALVLTAFLVVLLGDMLDNYWLGALIVGVLYAVIGGLMVVQGKNKLKNDDMRPEATLQTLREDKQWAQAEIQQVKRELT